MTTYTLTVPNKNGSYDGDYVIKQYTSLTINSGNTLTTDQPCKGLFIYVQGDCTINGTLSMRARGAASNPDNSLNTDGIKYPVLTSGGTATLAAADFAGCGTDIQAAVANATGIASAGKVITIPKRGSAGGAIRQFNSGGALEGGGFTGSAASASTSSDIVTVKLAGGGSGGTYRDNNSCGSWLNSYSGRGGNATAFSAGTGGGGKMSSYQPGDSALAGNGDDNGGEGGKGGNGHCGGIHTTTAGVGNPGGWDVYGSVSQSGNNQTLRRADSGTGGVIWLVVGGNLSIGSGGAIDVRGTDNNISRGQDGGVYGAGGGSGGGAVIILHKGTYTNSGSILTAGGAGFAPTAGSTSSSGAAGGAGISYIQQIL